jgi:hypothetical protein
MFVPHIVGLDRFLLRMRFNRPFMRISRILVLSLVALLVLGCAGEWGKGVTETVLNVVCKTHLRACYEGKPFTMREFVAELNGPLQILGLPVIGVFASSLLLFKPSRTYLGILVLSFVSFALLLFGSEPHPYFDYQLGSGQKLAIFSIFYLCLLSLPLAVAEQVESHPTQWQFWNNLSR